MRPPTLAGAEVRPSQRLHAFSTLPARPRLSRQNAHGRHDGRLSAILATVRPHYPIADEGKRFESYSKT